MVKLAARKPPTFRAFRRVVATGIIDAGKVDTGKVDAVVVSIGSFWLIVNPKKKV